MRISTHRWHPSKIVALVWLLAVTAAWPGPAGAEGPPTRMEPRRSLYLYDGDGRLDGVERQRDRTILRYDGNGDPIGADRLFPRPRPLDGARPHRSLPGPPGRSPLGKATGPYPADPFTYDGDVDLTGATRSFPNLPDDAPSPEKKTRDPAVE